MPSTHSPALFWGVEHFLFFNEKIKKRFFFVVCCSQAVVWPLGLRVCSASDAQPWSQPRWPHGWPAYTPSGRSQSDQRPRSRLWCRTDIPSPRSERKRRNEIVTQITNHFVSNSNVCLYSASEPPRYEKSSSFYLFFAWLVRFQKVCSGEFLFQSSPLWCHNEHQYLSKVNDKALLFYYYFSLLPNTENPAKHQVVQAVNIKK